MAGSVNKAILIGSLGRDPEVRMAGTAKVASFSIACNESWKDKATGEKHEKTEWLNIVAWRGLADVAERYFRKGSRVYIEGRITTRTWEDKNGGGKRSTTEILADEILMLDGKRDGSDERRAEPSGDPVGYMGLSDDDNPFA